ncbi:MAG: FmdB family zinc ribbon protein [Desulfatiglandales bacterium]
MPIYEFYCKDCHMIFNFYSSSVNTEKRPLCPKCHKTRLERRLSVFATPRSRRADDDLPLPDFDESKMGQAMDLLAREAEHMDEEDPRQAARLMRKITDMTGLELGPGMEEALSRMASGEDPEQVEAEMGERLGEEEPFSFKEKSSPTPQKRRPPAVDEGLYYL